MTARDSDRNLLFGILALQMDFITRDQLVAGMHAWVVEKSRPLGELLVEQRHMTAERCALLDALVQEHLKQHQDDPQKSLAALSSIESVRQDLKQLGDPNLAATLVFVAANPPEDPYATLGAEIGQSTSAGARFRILRPHAKGGLGQISVALDEELHREVALKEIQTQHAHHPESRRRFLVEAQVTGGLEHPGIVPVYGLGTYADGRPYYAMRFVRGDSLKSAIETFHTTDWSGRESERSLELRRLLGRFVDVCNAIAYAHSRGVLHRDLKPGNIMLGNYGETLVVDWGLAKVLGKADDKVAEVSSQSELRLSSGSSEGQTLPGSAVGTPGYMSPEQVEGKLDQLGPATDVYSLGATLYTLLTGKPPVESTVIGELLRRTVRGEIVPARQVHSQTPIALSAICEKAMALEPADRYPSPRELADDIERYLADEPVSAQQESLLMRVTRLFRKHRVHAVAAASLLIAIASAVTAAVIYNYAEEANTQRLLAEASAEETRRQRLLAEANAEEAKKQQRLAEVNAELATRNAEEATKQHWLAEANAEQARRNAEEASKQQMLAEANVEKAWRQLELSWKNAVSLEQELALLREEIAAQGQVDDIIIGAARRRLKRALQTHDDAGAPLPAESEPSENMLSAAFSFLQMADRTGYFDVLENRRVVLNDPEFAPLRARREYQPFFGALRNRDAELPVEAPIPQPRAESIATPKAVP